MMMDRPLATLAVPSRLGEMAAAVIIAAMGIYSLFEQHQVPLYQRGCIFAQINTAHTPEHSRHSSIRDYYLLSPSSPAFAFVHFARKGDKCAVLYILFEFCTSLKCYYKTQNSYAWLSDKSVI